MNTLFNIPNTGGMVANMTSKHKTAVTSLLFIKKMQKICNPRDYNILPSHQKVKK